MKYYIKLHMQGYNYSPLHKEAWFSLLDFADRRMALSIFFQEALVSVSSQASNIWLQQYSTLVGHPASMLFSFPVGRSKYFPISFHIEA